ncbi:MAG: DUF6603 domain-containing protein [Saprospiraceae bacterium]|nr:DUF6603 domain-containing protein [Saprospiraceae bacterium]
MAEGNNNGDLYIFRQLLNFFYELLKPLLTALSDSQARAELLESLGLDSSRAADGPSLPGTSSLEDYINGQSQQDEAFALASALADLTQLMAGLEGFIESAKSAEEGDGERTSSEILTALLNLLTLDYIRRRAPGFHSAIQLLNVIDSATAAEGGSISFFKDIVFGYFKRVGNGLKNFQTEEDAKQVSDSLFFLFSLLLFGVDYLLRKYNVTDEIEIRSGYGYEGFASSTTPNGDQITDRAFTYSVGFPLIKEGEGKAFNTLVFVPKDQGGIAIAIDLTGKFKQPIPLDADGKLKLLFELDASGFFRIGEGAEAELSEGKNKFSIAFEHNLGSDNKWTLLDRPVFKFGIETYKFGFGVKPDDFELKFFTKILVEFDKGNLTGFPYMFLPGKIDEKIPIGVGYSLKRNFFVDGSGSIGAEVPESDTGEGSRERDVASEIAKRLLNAINFRIPIHKDIAGVVGFEYLYMKAGVEGDFDTLDLELSLDFWLKFGPPLLLTVNRLGAVTSLEKRNDSGGLGGYDIGLKIKPPTGAGVRVNAGPVTGGGFLSLDDEKGEYFGALELDFKNLFALKAVGIINTKMPDGSEGFSMIIIITAEFTPIQLGLGFTLNGVGGLLGLNRTANVEALRVGLRTNAIKSILFPEDVIGNIYRIISDLREIFPIEEDVFLVGLMAKFGWGTPSLITVELGIILELPDPKIIILGVVKIVLPEERAALLKIQINFLGVIDFENQFIYFEARLFESHLVGFPLTGSLAFVVGWGEQTLFAISIGGFHPDFKDYPNVPTLPGAFRDMDRIGISLLRGNPRLGIECYFAVTSNTVQFGAKAELLANGPMGFNLYGLLAFDALFIFNPFRFIITLEATLAIRRGSNVLFGIRFHGRLEGPTPWHVEGEVSFSLLFFDVTIGFSATWGDPPPAINTATEDLRSLMLKEMQDKRNWKVLTPANNHQYVTLRQLDEAETSLIIIHPFGELVFSQQTLPLNYKIEKYGERKPKDVDLFSITRVSVGIDNPAISGAAYNAEKELFAPGNFTKLSDSQKLSRKSFEKMDGGFKMMDSGTLKTVSTGLNATELDYELDYTSDDKPKEKSSNKLNTNGFLYLSRSAAVSQSILSWKNASANPLNRPEEVNVNGVEYTLANTADLKEYIPGFRVGSQAEAFAKYNEILAAEPELATSIQVVESFELTE